MIPVENLFIDEGNLHIFHRKERFMLASTSSLKDAAYFNGGKEFSITYSFLKLLTAPVDSMNWSSLSFVDSVLEVN